MTNWCYTSVNITAPKAQIQALDSFLDDAAASGKRRNDFGEMWLGHILERLGYDEQSIREGKKVCRCRGAIKYVDVCEENISLAISSAWGPQIGPVLLASRCFAPDAEITYSAEEPSTGLFMTNDPDLKDAVMVDSYIGEQPDDYPEEFRDVHEPLKMDFVMEVLKKDLGHSGTFDKLAWEFMEKYECVSLNAFETVELEDFLPVEEGGD